MNAKEKLYDAVMRLPIVALTLYFLGREVLGIRGLVAIHPYFGGDWQFLVALAARVSIVLFLAVLASFHASRLRPIGKHTDWKPKVIALLGAFLTYALLLLPRSAPDALWDSLSMLIIMTGSMGSILVAFNLGRSLSIMPEARKLVTAGPYRRVRHPLYLAEEIATLGVFLQFRSWQAALLLLVHFYFQIRRMDGEETILAKTFPEYVEYKQRSFRLVPGLY
jgi:protein-S-isoprenylcysteine O-methyltransferase Ste14